MKSNLCVLAVSVLMFTFLMPHAAFAAQSQLWAQTIIDDPKGMWDIGLAYSKNGSTLGLATTLGSGMQQAVLYYSQIGQNAWQKETVWDYGNIIGGITDVALDYDASGGVGIAVAGKSVTIGGTTYPGDTALFYMYRSPTGAWGTPELVYHYHMEHGYGVALVFNFVTLSLKFDGSNRPVVAFINNRYDIDDDANEWCHASAHYAVRTSGWQITDVENAFVNSRYGYPVLCLGYGGYGDIDLAIEPGALPYTIVYANGPWQANAESLCELGNPALVRVKADAQGNFNKAPITESQMGEGFGHLAFAYDTKYAVEHYAFETYVPGPQKVYYMCGKNESFSTPRRIAQASGTVARSLGGIAVSPTGLPHVSIFEATGHNVYVLNGPDWPTTESTWVKVNKNAGPPEVVNNDWRWRIASKPPSASTSSGPNIAVAYQTSNTDFFQYSKCVVSTGCAGTSSTPPECAGAGGDVLIYVFTLLLMVAPARRMLRLGKKAE